MNFRTADSMTNKQYCRGRDTGCPVPPSQIPAGGFPAPGSSGQLALAYAIEHVRGALWQGTGMPSRLWPAGRFASVGSVVLTALVACADCVDLLAPSPASGLTPCGWILRANPTPGAPGGTSCRCAALPAWPSQLVRQGLSGPPRFRVLPSARATLLDPGKPAPTSPFAVVSVWGSGVLKPSPLASNPFEAELLKQDAGPACGSRFSLGTLLDGRSTRLNHRSTGSPSAEQPSVLGSWLDFSIHLFRSELRRLGLRAWGTFTPGCTRLLRAHQYSILN